MVGQAQLIVDDVDVEVDLPGVLRAELADLQLDHETLDLGHERALDARLANVMRETEELEVVVLVDDLLDASALVRGQSTGEVAQRSSLTLVAAGRDVVWPFISGNSWRRSFDRRAVTFAPQPSPCWRERISAPMRQ